MRAARSVEPLLRATCGGACSLHYGEHERHCPVQAPEPGLALGAATFVSKQPKPADANAQRAVLTEWY